MAEASSDNVSPKISTLLAQQNGAPFISVEFFPPKTDAGLNTLTTVIEKLKTLNPLFTDYTWGAGGSTSDLTVDLCVAAKTRHGQNPNMHLTCTNMESEKVHAALNKCVEQGITNILALRGDPPAGQARWEATEGGFTCALDLVKYIRREYGDKFCISVAGYPEGHPDNMSTVESADALTESEKLRFNTEVKEDGTRIVNVCLDANYAKEIQYLKEKVDAGAEAIVTQMIFDSDVYVRFLNACREAGINVPILPGIMCVTTYAGFKRMTKFCKSRVPEEIAQRFEAIKDDEAAVKELGIQIGFEICKSLLAHGAPGLHFYTLNLANTTLGIVNRLMEEGALIARALEDTVTSLVAAAAISGQGVAETVASVVA